MFEISFNGAESLEDFIDAKKAYKDAIYDFTFEGRYLIYHFFVRDEARYVALDTKTGYGSEVTRRKDTSLYSAVNYRSMTPLILESIKYNGDLRYLNMIAFDPLSVIDSVFRVILPEYGFIIREEQIKLCKNMYIAMTEKQVGICEAEVGTGKTMAYLVAAIVARETYAKEYGFHLPVTITTSSIELQKMIVEKEIPHLSKMLQDYGLIRYPLTAVLRKGKEHYFCLARYYDYMNMLRQHAEKNGELIETIEKSRMETRAFDLDKWDMPAAIKGKVCLKGSCSRCGFADECRYSDFIERANEKGSIAFQVTNHNLYLMSVRASELSGGYRILQSSPYVIVDEAHKLLDAAQSVFGETVEEDAVKKYLNSVKYLCADEGREPVYKKLLTEAHSLSEELFRMLRSVLPEDAFDGTGSVSITLPPEAIIIILRLSQAILEIEELRRKKKTPYAIDGKRLSESFRSFIRQNNVNVWMTEAEDGKLILCNCPSNIADVMREKVWDRCISHILTSGTMGDGTDFSFFKRENGIDRIDKQLILETSTASPFDYAAHSRLFIPQDMPAPDNDDPDYIQAITDSILDLIKATNGHTAILFTSYKVLQKVYEKAVKHLDQYSVFYMTRNNKTVISEFKKSKNGVLFASGSMWEGVDCVGDGLSSVIIVRLPFPMRSALLEQKKESAGSLGMFIQQYALPEMLIKLRQGAGRLIRSENDTGVIAILDARAAKGTFSKSVLHALGQYPVVNTVEEIEKFLRSVKTDDYYNQ